MRTVGTAHVAAQQFANWSTHHGALAAALGATLATTNIAPIDAHGSALGPAFATADYDSLWPALGSAQHETIGATQHNTIGTTDESAQCTAFG